MLILSRKINECIVIDSRIIVKVVRVEGQIVKLGIQAPADVPVHRQEIYDEIQRNNQEAMTRMRMEIPRLPKSEATECVAPSAQPPMPEPAPLSIPPAALEKSAAAEAKSPAEETEPAPNLDDAPASETAEEKKTTKNRSNASTTKSGSTRTRRTKTNSTE